MAAFGLRMNAGWPFDTFLSQTGFDLRIEWVTEMALLIQKGWAEQTATHFRLTRSGLRFADSAAQLFLRLAPTELQT